MDAVKALQLLDGESDKFIKEASKFILSEAYLKEIIVKKPTSKNSSERRKILAGILETYMLGVFAGGIKHGAEEVEKARKFAEETPSIDPVVPEDAVAWYAGYAITLAGILDQAVLDKARDIIAQSIEEGLHWKDIVKELQKSDEFKSFSQHRLNTIAGTETTKAYNKGRLAQFKGSDGFVEALQYSAVLDKRTTPICKRLNGKIMAIDDPLVNVFLPPNHFNCRSIIIPITTIDDWVASDFSGVDKPEDGFNNPNWKPSKR